MIMTIDLTSDIPIYMQIKNAIIAGIAAGRLSPGQPIPSVRQLASDIGVNMQTVNKAYSLLKQDGYIEINRRKGAVIADRGTPDEGWQRTLLRDLSIIAQAACSQGMQEEEFIRTCIEAYRTSKGGI